MTAGENATGDPLRDPAAAAAVFAELRRVEPLRALDELTVWLQEIKASTGTDEVARSQILSHLQDASAAHLATLIGPLLARPQAERKARESAARRMNHHLGVLAMDLSVCARVLLERAKKAEAARPHAAAAAARALQAHRLQLKIALLRYVNAPAQLWRTAYALHAAAEAAACAAASVRLHPSDKTMTSATQELLRLLLLQCGAPEMMTPAQIEVADWALQHLDADFALSAPDAPAGEFCFDPASDAPPRRATAEADASGAALRYFGAGAGYDALMHLHQELEAARGVDTSAMRKDIASHAQASTVQHLLTFWGSEPPAVARQREAADGSLSVMHGFVDVWQSLSHDSGGSGLRLVDDEKEEKPATPPETWTLREAGGSHLGVAIAAGAGEWAQCGDVVLATREDGQQAVALVRALHAQPNGGLDASLFVVSREPQAVHLRPILPKDEEAESPEEFARFFPFTRVRALILADDQARARMPNLLMPPEHARLGQAFEVTDDGRYLKTVRLLRRGEDYARLAFEWCEAPSE